MTKTELNKIKAILAQLENASPGEVRVTTNNDCIEIASDIFVHDF